MVYNQIYRLSICRNGELSESNRVHSSVRTKLEKYNCIKTLARPLLGSLEKENDAKDKDKDKDSLSIIKKNLNKRYIIFHSNQGNQLSRVRMQNKYFSQADMSSFHRSLRTGKIFYIRNLIHTNAMDSIKIGRVYRISPEHLHQFIAKRERSK